MFEHALGSRQQSAQLSSPAPTSFFGLPILSGGNPLPNDCSGTYALDFEARVQSGQDANLVPGAEVRDAVVPARPPTTRSS